MSGDESRLSKETPGLRAGYAKINRDSIRIATLVGGDCQWFATAAFTLYDGGVGFEIKLSTVGAPVFCDSTVEDMLESFNKGHYSFVRLP